jgi:hypothetical protein
MHWNRSVVLLSLGLAACSQGPTTRVEEVATAQESDPSVRARRKYGPVQWPLKFKDHSFEARCYDTLTCSVWYAGVDQGDHEPSPPSSKYGPGYLDNWQGSHVGIRNFPDPAEVAWRSKDGTEHKTKIDIAAIFRDEVIMHRVPRGEIPELPHGKYRGDPSILLEVNDRTIRVYTRAHIPTRHFQKPGNPYSKYRNDLILVKTYKY